MPTATRKCRYCKERKRVDEMEIHNTGAYCIEGSHAFKYAIEKSQQIRKKDNRKRRRLENQDKLTHQIELTQRIFNKLIVLIDMDLPCISCGRFSCGYRWECGHRKTVAAFPELRFDFLNAHKQGQACNQGHKHNIKNKDTVEKRYDQGLIERYGEWIVDYLTQYHPPKNYIREQLKGMRREWSAECRLIEKTGEPSRDWRQWQLEQIGEAA